MEHNPQNDKDKPRMERLRRNLRREELLGTLPPPKEAAGFVTAMLSDEAREHILDALSNGEPLDSVTPRLIAYNLIAHAPDGSSTSALYDYFLTGYGEYEKLRKEYLPLYNNAIMPAEGRVLLDSLGTYLFNREANPPSHRAPRHHASALVVGTDRKGNHSAIAFAYSMPLDEDELELHAASLFRLCFEEGDGFRAYLRAPGIDSLSPTLVGDFHTAYIADATAVDENRERLTKLGTFAWSAVEIAGGIHIFVHPTQPSADV
jgi:hypothetical protein